MSVATFDGLLALETLEGCKAELVDGACVVSPTPDGDHEDCISTVMRQIQAYAKVSMDASGMKGLRMPSGGGCPKNHVIPDITFAPRELRIFRGAPSWMDADGVAMVVEVTSTRPSDDRTVKRHCYARAAIPLYLIIDRDESRVLLYSDPAGEDYASGVSVPFGEPLQLPEPFAFALETAELL
ncbi:Uma2 family endonuclease [Streptacidiphilus sp. BW17]|uniref:Uma2 family endonuclease n=1 Tax=Streptacidiphilus sp. BW17 TaxID=3156274 RepID=UPI0035176AC0